MAFMWKMALPILCILCLVVFSEAFFGSNKEKGRGKDAAAQGNTSLGLVEMAGRLVWERLSKVSKSAFSVISFAQAAESRIHTRHAPRGGTQDARPGLRR